MACLLQAGDPQILKNIPSINKLLQEVKHLVKIQLLKFPNGLPEHESDFDHTVLKSNGEFVVRKRLKVEEDEEMERKQLAEEHSQRKWCLQEETVDKELMNQKLQNTIHMEYFKEDYKYKRNQDGKEYRYSFNKPTE